MNEPTNAELADGRPWCIAGGWAACPQLAIDQDVWIFVDPFTGERAELDRLSYLAESRKDMLSDWDRVIKVEGPSLAESKGDHCDFDYENLLKYGNMGLTTIKVGTIGDRQILLTDAADIQQLLSSFDISTHQCAIDEHMNFIIGTGWTPIGATPNILRTGGEQTAVRLKKITRRYQLA